MKDKNADYLSIAELADRVGKTRQWIYRMIEKPEIAQYVRVVDGNKKVHKSVAWRFFNVNPEIEVDNVNTQETKPETPDQALVRILQEQLDGKGVLIEKSDNRESVKFALLFEFDGDINCIRHVLYNCTSSRPSIESETKEDTIEPGTEKLSITADPRADGLVKARTGDTTDAATYDGWYSAVYLPTEAATPKSSTSTK